MDYLLNKKQLVAWNKTLKMYAYVAENWTLGDETEDLKAGYLDSLKEDDRPRNDCFLCDVDFPWSCEQCPINLLLDEAEHQPGICNDDDDLIVWDYDPVGFYSFLHALDKKAKEMGLIPRGKSRGL